jgi:protein-S-isoprenylcysteine O-methyltransferase Ste14
MNLSSQRLIALVLLDLVVFGLAAFVMLQVMPKPLQPFDYLIVGGVATFISLLAVWVLLWREMPNRSAFLFEKRPKK